MSLTYSSQIIGNARYAGFHLQKGIGHYLLGFIVAFEIPAYRDRQEYRFKNALAKVFAGASQSSLALLGLATPGSPVLIRTTENSGSGQ